MHVRTLTYLSFFLSCIGYTLQSNAAIFERNILKLAAPAHHYGAATITLQQGANIPSITMVAFKADTNTGKVLREWPALNLNSFGPEGIIITFDDAGNKPEVYYGLSFFGQVHGKEMILPAHAIIENPQVELLAKIKILSSPTKITFLIHYFSDRMKHRTSKFLA